MSGDNLNRYWLENLHTLTRHLRLALGSMIKLVPTNVQRRVYLIITGKIEINAKALRKWSTLATVIWRLAQASGHETENVG
jgi:hypothetical protein